jgi:hypothetical protein
MVGCTSLARSWDSGTEKVKGAFAGDAVVEGFEEGDSGVGVLVGVC